MGWIITVVIFFIIAIAIFIWRPKLTVEQTRVNGSGYREKVDVTRSLWRLGFIPMGLAILLVFFNSFTQVHAKEIGVGVSFGKPVAQYDSGLHVKPFWQSVTKIDGTVHTDSYGTDTKGSEKGLVVRLGDGNPATASTTIRWHVNAPAVDYIYKTYRDTDKLRDAVVETQFKAIVNDVFSTFNPTSSEIVDAVAKGDSATTQSFSPPYDDMAVEIANKMTDAVKDSEGIAMIVIDKVTVSGVKYSETTEKRISGIVDQAAKTQQAKQLQATNTALATANGELTNSLSGPDGVKVLVQQCLQDLADGKFSAPAGFSCWPGAGSSVVIPSSN